jgi:uncharacterized membrane protein
MGLDDPAFWRAGAISTRWSRLRAIQHRPHRRDRDRDADEQNDPEADKRRHANRPAQRREQQQCRTQHDAPKPMSSPRSPSVSLRAKGSPDRLRRKRPRKRAVDDITPARALHVLAVVLWIGGVGFVTTVMLPAIRRLKAGDERPSFFDAFERRFARQARITTVLTGLTGFYMLARLDLSYRFREASFWWMHAMVLVWLLFTLMLFMLEPAFLHHWLLARARAAPEATFVLVEWLHRALLALSIVTIFGVVTGSHGFLLFG